MKNVRKVIYASAALVALAPAHASASERSEASIARELPAYLQCVPYARAVSGIQIFGDAYTWWEQAAGRFQRGNRPKVGAVMAFRPHRKMRLGHVAAVSKVIDKRTVLLRHANWSPINGRRGQIEDDVRAVDVSPKNDWSQVRVWYDPLGGLGKTAWPVEGFIYAKKVKPLAPAARFARKAEPRKPSKQFANAFLSLDSKPKAHAVNGVATPRSANPEFAALFAKYGS